MNTLQGDLCHDLVNALLRLRIVMGRIGMPLAISEIAARQMCHNKAFPFSPNSTLTRRSTKLIPQNTKFIVLIAEDVGTEFPCVPIIGGNHLLLFPYGLVQQGG